MSTTVTRAERAVAKKSASSKGERRSGGGGGGSSPRGDDGGSYRGGEANSGRFSPDRYRIAVWGLLAAIVMMFAALASVYVFLVTSDGWRSIPLPRQLWLSTGLIIASSFTFKAALGSLKHGEDTRYRLWLLVTLVLGLAFLGSQLLAWRQLVAWGQSLAGNGRAFFYLFTGIHAAHLLGGILALSYLLLRTGQRPKGWEAALRRQTTSNVVSLYWHFMDGLWVFLFLLLLLWR